MFKIFKKEKTTTHRIYTILGFKLKYKRKNNMDTNAYTIGEFSYVGKNFSCPSHKSSIGKYCSIGSNVFVGLPQHPLHCLSSSPIVTQKNFMDFPDTDFPTIDNYGYKEVEIGNDVWVGQDVNIMGGIKIGHGAVIGANTLVTKDVPPYAIVGGVPAKIIRYRFDEATIKILLETKWWELDVKEIAKLPFTDINECLKKLKSIRQRTKNTK